MMPPRIVPALLHLSFILWGMALGLGLKALAICLCKHPTPLRGQTLLAVFFCSVEESLFWQQLLKVS